MRIFWTICLIIIAAIFFAALYLAALWLGLRIRYWWLNRG